MLACSGLSYHERRGVALLIFCKSRKLCWSWETCSNRKTIFKVLFQTFGSTNNFLHTVWQTVFVPIKTWCRYGTGVTDKPLLLIKTEETASLVEKMYRVGFFFFFLIHRAFQKCVQVSFFSFSLPGRVSCFRNSSATLDINGANMKARALRDVDLSRKECSNNNRGASARHDSQGRLSHHAGLNF